MDEEAKTNVIPFPGVAMEDTPGQVLNVLTAAVGLSIAQHEYEVKTEAGFEDSAAPRMAGSILHQAQKLLAEDPQMFLDVIYRLGIVVQDSSEDEYDVELD